MKSVTVYRERGGIVEKELVTSDILRQGNIPGNYHQRIIDTYYQLECEGKLNGRLTPQAKQKIKDLHTYAQTPAYWGERNTLGYTDGLEN